MMAKTPFVVILTLFLSSVTAFSRVDLTGDNWIVYSRVNTSFLTTGRVPGSVHTDLLRAGIIPDPLYRDNDVKLAWVGRTDWTYVHQFTVADDVANAARVVLVAEGLDTIATVELNGQSVGAAENMFVRYVYDITGVLKAGSNKIIINFNSAVNEAKARANNSNYVVPPECPQAVQNGECHVNQIRKEQCSFSWDWGPSFPTLGVWKPIYIDSFSSAIIRDLTAVVTKVNDQWQIAVEVEFDSTNSIGFVTGRLSAELPELNITYTKAVVISTTANTFKFVIGVPVGTSVPLWWPNGYGSQPLFDLVVNLNTSVDTSQKSIRIGFRTVELVQDPVYNVTQPGLTFYYKVNGVPIFLKGSNWIPADSFQERITPQQLSHLLHSAANVSTNAMRVWGGGVYESDEFYQLCDQLGIMIWQDFMFSVALYPTYQSFLNSVSTEIKQQLWRLKSHPSILVWAGNNENEAGLRQNWFGIKNYTLYYEDYVKLYVSTMKPLIEAEDPSRVYLTSSPSDGKETEKEGYVAQDPGSELYGDVHFYDYSVDQWNVKGFKVPRMASEFGVQAWCNNESLASVFTYSDFAMDSDMVNHRQHHGGGNTEMAAEVALHIKLPTSLDEKQKFIDFIYLTQINQAMSIRTQTEHYRRHQSQLLSDGRGLTMGALYWQLNDIWQAPTWASIGYDGSWKMLHYFAKSFFAKHLISPYYLDDDTLDVYIVIDELPVLDARDPLSGALYFKPIMDQKDFSGINVPVQESNRIIQNALRMTTGNLKIDLYQYTSFQSLHSWSVNYNLKTTAESVFTKKVSDIISESGCPAKQKCILTLTATDTSGVQKSSSWFALTYPKDSVLPPANVKISTVVKLGNSTFEIEVTSDVIALYVWISSDVLGLFSDNGFPMFTSTVKVIFKSVDDVSLPQLMSRLRVRSITDVKNSDSFVVG